MHIHFLKLHRQSSETLQFSSDCHYMLCSAGETHVKCLCLFCFILSDEISLIQIDHVSTEKPIYNIHISSVIFTSSLIKLMSLMC